MESNNHNEVNINKSIFGGTTTKDPPKLVPDLVDSKPEDKTENTENGGSFNEIIETLRQKASQIDKGEFNTSFVKSVTSEIKSKIKKSINQTNDEDEFNRQLNLQIQSEVNSNRFSILSNNVCDKFSMLKRLGSVADKPDLDTDKVEELNVIERLEEDLDNSKYQLNNIIWQLRSLDRPPKNNINLKHARLSDSNIVNKPNTDFKKVFKRGLTSKH